MSGKVAPTSEAGKWAVAMITVAVALAIAVVTLVPGDSLAAMVVAASALACGVGGAVTSYVALVRAGDRALSVYGATLLLVGGIAFVLLHSLVLSD